MKRIVESDNKTKLMYELFPQSGVRFTPITDRFMWIRLCATTEKSTTLSMNCEIAASKAAILHTSSGFSEVSPIFSTRPPPVPPRPAELECQRCAPQSAPRFWPGIRCSAIAPTARPSFATLQDSVAALKCWALRELARQPVAHGRPRSAHRSSQKSAPEELAMTCRNHAPLPCWDGMTDDARFCTPELIQRECVGRMIKCARQVCDRMEKTES